MSEASYRKMKILVRGEQVELPQYVNDASDADIPEKIFRRLCAALAGFVDFGCRHGFRKWQFGIFHHYPADQ